MSPTDSPRASTSGSGSSPVGAAGRVERQQTLRATVEWSYQLLGDDERVVFDRLGVFVGTFDAPAAIAVASADELDGWEVTEALSTLVAKSMLLPETGPDGSTRYAMLETLRQFGRERLDEAADSDRWRRRRGALVEIRASGGRRSSPRAGDEALS